MPKSSCWQLFILFLLRVVVLPVTSIVVLTYPPARRYAVDYLDSRFVQWPCGMPKGASVVEFPAGGSFNVSWKLSTAVKGGFKLELMDVNNELQAILSPAVRDSEDFMIDDISTREYRVTLPPSLTCRNCTVRLVRRVEVAGARSTNFSSSLEYWSCADVDIVAPSAYKETCSGHGRATLRRCRCQQMYYGERCQLANECETDRQCGRFGQCASLSSHSFPRKQCVCRLGYYGPACQFVNPVTLRRRPNSLQVYQHMTLAPNVSLHWRYLPDVGQVEVLLRARYVPPGLGWLAVGWRPLDGVNGNKNSSIIGGTELCRQIWRNRQLEPATATITDTISATDSRQLARSRRSLTSSSTSPTLTASISQHTSTTSTVAPANQRIAGEGDKYERDNDGGKDHTTMLDEHGSCVDVVVGRAIGDYGRVEDAFALEEAMHGPALWSSAAPFADAVYGGALSLAAGSVYQDSGDSVTTLIFRKNITASEWTDFSIAAGPMHVVWAVGGAVSTPPTEEKHVNRWRSGRTAQVALLSVEESTSGGEHLRPQQRLSFEAYDFCGAEWRWPVDCDMDDNTCEYAVRWQYLAHSDSIRFTIQSAHRDQWSGVGFSRTADMSDSDMLMSYVHWSGRAIVLDRWASGHLAPVTDARQNVVNVSGTARDGRQQVQFERRRHTGDSKDLSFTDGQCLYLLLPVGGGRYDTKWKRFNKHDTTPFISRKKICISPCDTKSRLGSDGAVLPASPPPNIQYEVRLLLRAVGGSSVAAPLSNSREFRVLSERVQRDIEPVVQRIAGFRRVQVARFLRMSEGLLLQLFLSVSRSKLSKELKRAAAADELPLTLANVFNASVVTGRVGQLKVHTNYLYVQQAPVGVGVRSSQREADGTLAASRWDRGAVQRATLLLAVSLLLLVVMLRAVCGRISADGRHAVTIKHAAPPTTTAQHRKYDRRLDGGHWREIAARADTSVHQPQTAGATTTAETASGKADHHRRDDRQVPLDMFGAAISRRADNGGTVSGDLERRAIGDMDAWTARRQQVTVESTRSRIGDCEVAPRVTSSCDWTRRDVDESAAVRDCRRCEVGCDERWRARGGHHTAAAFTRQQRRHF